jgi:hypothetical protein
LVSSLHLLKSYAILLLVLNFNHSNRMYTVRWDN